MSQGATAAIKPCGFTQEKLIELRARIKKGDLDEKDYFFTNNEFAGKDVPDAFKPRADILPHLPRCLQCGHTIAEHGLPVAPAAVSRVEVQSARPPVGSGLAQARERFDRVVQKQGSAALLLFRGTLAGGREPVRAFVSSHPTVSGSCMRVNADKTVFTFAWRETDGQILDDILEFCCANNAEMTASSLKQAEFCDYMTMPQLDSGSFVFFRTLPRIVRSRPLFHNSDHESDKDNISSVSHSCRGSALDGSDEEEE